MNWPLVTAGIVGIIYPLYFLFTYKKNYARIKTEPGYKLIDYKRTVLLFWLATILILTNQFLFGEPPLNFLPTIQSIIPLVVGLVILAFLVLQYKQSKVTEQNLETLQEKLDHMMFYMPENKQEFNWFVILSFSAGICEEIIFRLYLYEFLIGYTGIILAILITTFLFTLTHIGSGKKNLIGVFALGLILAIIYYFTGNIWIPILLHIGMDFNAGVIGYRVNQALKN